MPTKNKLIVSALAISLVALVLLTPGARDVSQAITWPSWLKWPAKKTVVVKPQPKKIFNQVKRFTSAAEFKEYLAKGRGRVESFGYSKTMSLQPLSAQPMGIAKESMDDGAAASSLPNAPSLSGNTPSTERYSQTNTQVLNIDEPDVVKTDDQELYYSSWRSTPVVAPMAIDADDDMRVAPGEEFYPPYEYSGVTRLIKAWPAEAVKVEGTIAKNGDLLLSGNILTIFSENKLFGYDVSSKTNPREAWSIELGNNDSLVGLRLHNNKLYLATRTYVNQRRPCPYEPLKVRGVALPIRCGDIYYPTVPVSTDSTYNIFVIDPETGAVSQKTSFVGSAGDSAFYMSANALYLTYYYPGDLLKYSLGFFAANRDLVPAWLIDKLTRLQNYDISDSSKMSEFEYLVSKWQGEWSDDEQLKMQTELTNRMTGYYAKHQRDLAQTGIAKISLDGLKVAGVGNVPGRLLNQFSLDEYNNNLRVASTVGEDWWGMGNWGGGARQTVNDVYVLDGSMNVIGSVKDLGKDERIYSVRFLADRGYVVTFKQTDPFYVLDLADPRHPELKGELKIPGYSSYLHPVDATHILGLGQESGKVKLSLFDVSNPSAPVEISKYTLDEYWSEAQNNHHAFLLDKKHQIFFLPGSRGAYILSYANNNLTLATAVSDVQVQRAVYINDNLYILGTNELTILDETNWKTVKKMRW